MTYATQQNLLDRYGHEELVQVSDRADPPTGRIDAAVIAAALGDADGEINGYLAARYTTPLAPAPSILTWKACVIARYLLWRDRASERVRLDYQDAIAWLRAVSIGTIALGDATTVTEPVSAGAPQISEGCRRFDDSTLRDF